MQSIIVYQALQLDDEVGGMLFWEKDIPFPKSLGNEVLGWKTLWQSTDRELAMKMLSQTSIVFWSSFAYTLPITSAEVERSFSRMK